MKNAKISIVIPVHNKEDETIYETINSLIKQTYKGKKEIILVNDGDFDLRKTKGVIHKKVNPCSRAKARNIGIKNATGEIICFTDSDCLPNKDWIKNIAEEFENEKTGIVFGPITWEKNNVFITAEHLCWAHELYPSMKREKRMLASTANMAVRKFILKKINFNESLEGSEDSDLSIRIYNEGYDIIFSPKVIVLHKPKRGNLKNFLKHWYNYGEWTIKFIYIHKKELPNSMLFPENKALLFLSSFITVPLSTLLIVYNNFKHDKKSVIYSPLIFLARLTWAIGALKA